MEPVFLFDHPVFREHDAGPGHPERPERLDAIARGIDRRGLTGRLNWVRPSPAGVEDLRRVHTEAHVRQILDLRGRQGGIDPDTRVSPSSVDAALAASGGCIQAVDKVLKEPAASAFCLGRPPGHHAESERAMGFCLFNHVAVAAAYAVAEKGVKRVLIFDPDVHHGNGTQEIFYERADVCYVSIHEWPLFPGTGQASEIGSGNGEGFTVNLPLPAGMGDAEYGFLVEHAVLPRIRSFAPELVLFSAGFDAHEDDPLGEMRVSSGGFVWLYARVLRELATKKIPAVFCLEGGYSLEALEETVPAVIEALLEDTPPEATLPREVHPAARRAVEAVAGLLDGEL